LRTIETVPIGSPRERRGHVPWRGYYLPFKFEIKVDDDRYPLTTLEVHTSPEGPRCVAIRVQARRQPDEPFSDRIEIPRRLPLAGWFDKGTRLAAQPLEYWLRTEYQAGPDPISQQIYDELATKRGPKPKPDLFYEGVARVAKKNPDRRVEAITKEMQTRFGTPPTRRTVQYWLKACKDRGLL